MASDGELISAFVGKSAELNPNLVTFNGNSFDLTVLSPNEKRPRKNCGADS
jgi:hypothetical protein